MPGQTNYPTTADSFARPQPVSPEQAAQAISNFGAAIEAIEGVLGTTANGLGATPFHVVGTLTSAAAATPVVLLPDAAVPAGKKCYVTGFLLRVNGGTLWGTTANVKIQDTNGVVVDFATVLVALLSSQARVGCEPKANLTLEDAYSLGTGGTAAKGLQVVGNANGTGSDLKVTVWGYVK